MREFFVELSCKQDGGPVTVLRRERLPPEWVNLVSEQGVKGLKQILQTIAKLASGPGPGRPGWLDVTQAQGLRRRGAPRDPEITRALELQIQGTTFREICRALGKRTSSDRRNLGQAMRMRAWRARSITKSKMIR